MSAKHKPRLKIWIRELVVILSRIAGVAVREKALRCYKVSDKEILMQLSVRYVPGVPTGSAIFAVTKVVRAYCSPGSQLTSSGKVHLLKGPP